MRDDLPELTTLQGVCEVGGQKDCAQIPKTSGPARALKRRAPKACTQSPENAPCSQKPKPSCRPEDLLRGHGSTMASESMRLGALGAWGLGLGFRVLRFSGLGLWVGDSGLWTADYEVRVYEVVALSELR